LVDQQQIVGVLRRAGERVISIPEQVAGAERVVVTHVAVHKGQRISGGTLLATVSGRPMIVLRGAFGSYRDLNPGDTGDDVRQLQRALPARYPVAVTGTFDRQTRQAVRELYAAVGGTPINAVADGPGSPEQGSSGKAPKRDPDAIMIPLGELIFLSQLPATVGAVSARVGATGGTSLLTLVSGGWLVTAQLTSSQLQYLTALPPTAALSLPDGQRVELVSAEPAATRTPGLSGTSGPAGNATFAVDGAAPGGLGAATTVRVRRSTSPVDALVVPASALWTSAAGQVSVTVVEGGGRSRTRRDVPVTVLVSLAGENAVRAVGGSGAGLAVGMRVLVGIGDGP
jgi:hypothetical protein